MPNSSTPSVANLRQAIALAEQIEKLQSQLASLIGGGSPAVSTPRVASAVPSPTKPGKKGKRGKRVLSPEARERIAAAQRARWARAGKGKSASVTAAAPVAAKSKAAKKKTGLTAAGRAKLAASMKARWAARKKGAPAPNAAKK